MKPLLKYPGGKERELQYVIERLPDKIDNYYEPFFGGGAIFFGLDTACCKHTFLNDKSDDLVLFYNNVAHSHALFFYFLDDYIYNWEYLSAIVDNNYNEFKNNTKKIKALINPLYSDRVINAVDDKIKRMRELEKKKGKLPPEDIKDNIECAIKQGYYYFIREVYNSKIRNNIFDEERAAAFYFMREYCYSSMFRFNSSGEFNVPYGGISYNRKTLNDKVQKLKDNETIKKFSNAVVKCLDFEEFLNKYPPHKNDFMFLDPPYDSEFSEYDKNSFNKDDQHRLAEYLINKCECPWLLIIKASPLILKLYKHGTPTQTGRCLFVEGFDKKYSVSFKNRNLKDCEHLIIKNY